MPIFLNELNQYIGLELSTFSNSENKKIRHLSLDSRNIEKNDIFISLKGQKNHGQEFLKTAIERGAIAIYSEYPIPDNLLSIPYYQVPHLRQKLPDLARFFYGDPSQSLWLSAVTGTNGKTSIAYLLSDAHEKLLAHSYYIGTIGYGPVHTLRPLINTTPDIITLNRILSCAVASDIQYVNCEASSHGLDQDRLAGLSIKTAIFTNLSHDHLDYHQTLEQYFQAKLKLFTRPELECAILNIDDPYSSRLQNALHARVHCCTTSLINPQANYFAGVLEYSTQGLSVRLKAPGYDGLAKFPVLSAFQISNLLAVLATLITQGFPSSECVKVLSQLPTVKGRMESWTLPSGAKVIIDYAHTPDALLKVLTCLRPLTKNLITVFGCGGEKDRAKRPLMAEISERLSDQVIVTADNPRHESFEQIVNDMLPGFKKAHCIHIEPDRRIAILKALTTTDKHTIVLLAGKGHETYMERQGIRSHFDERDVVQEVGGSRELLSPIVQ